MSNVATEAPNDATGKSEIAIDLDDHQITGAIDAANNDQKNVPKPVHLPSPLSIERSVSAIAMHTVTSPASLLQQLSTSPRTAKAVATIENNKTTESVIILFYFLGMSAACLTMGILYDENTSECADLEFIMGISVNWFLYVAGATSLFMLLAAVYAWYNGCAPEEESQFQFDGKADTVNTGYTAPETAITLNPQIEHDLIAQPRYTLYRMYCIESECLFLVASGHRPPATTLSILCAVLPFGTWCGPRWDSLCIVTR